MSAPPTSCSMRDERGGAHALARPLPAPGRPALAGKEGVSRARSPAPTTAGPTASATANSSRSSPTGPTRRSAARSVCRRYPTAEFLGLVWVFIGDRPPHPLTAQLPEELVDAPPLLHRRSHRGPRPATGACSRRTASTRVTPSTSIVTRCGGTFKVMPTWNLVHIERHGRWIYRIEDERHWDADFPGLGPLDEQAVVEDQASSDTRQDARQHRRCDEAYDPYIESRDFPGFASLSVPGVAAHRLPAVHPLRVLRADRGRTHALRGGHGAVQGLGVASAALLRQVPRWDPLALPRAVLGPGPLDGVIDERASRAPLPTGHLA